MKRGEWADVRHRQKVKLIGGDRMWEVVERERGKTVFISG